MLYAQEHVTYWREVHHVHLQVFIFHHCKHLSVRTICDGIPQAGEAKPVLRVDISRYESIRSHSQAVDKVAAVAISSTRDKEPEIVQWTDQGLVPEGEALQVQGEPEPSPERYVEPLDRVQLLTISTFPAYDIEDLPEKRC